LSVHAARTKAPLRVQQKLDEPKIVDTFDCSWNAKDMGMRFKKEAPMIKEFVSGLEKEKLECIKNDLAEKG
jgi:glycyl-tRNA synthetase